MASSRKKNNIEITEKPEPVKKSPARRIITAMCIAMISIIIGLAMFHTAGRVGDFIFQNIFQKMFGYGAYLVPVFGIITSIILFRREYLLESFFDWISITGIIVSLLGFFHMMNPVEIGGGWFGMIIGGTLSGWFDTVGAFCILLGIFASSFVGLFAHEIDWHELGEKITHMFTWESSTKSNTTESTTMSWEELENIDETDIEEPDEEIETTPHVTTKKSPTPVATPVEKPDIEDTFINAKESGFGTYEFPPLSLLGKSAGKPSVGDIKAQANLIKRTLQNFGIDVEMDEVSIGPTVTRYALKPAEGIKLSRIVALKSDLALALAAHPIRIEAPIPGKSLVGIEIPNTVKSSVGLGSLLAEPEFEKSPAALLVALGKGVTGKAYFKDLAKMPHLLIAGTTGSGKSVTVHNIILSLLYKNGPEDMRFIMVDPKRVELTLYNNIPHLLTPVIKEPKKAIMALRWAAKEMERRYDLLESYSSRDIGSYHTNIMRPWHKEHEGEDIEHIKDKPERMPYIVIIIDELADIMQAYPRELEAGIVRLAQMSRAVGIHLILSTQRPSVNVITGLIKANVPSRLALQVASQIDSRTILDAPGAEALLGKGDTLFQGSDMNKPERMQCGNVSEEEVKRVVQYIVTHNDQLPDDVIISESADESVHTTSGSSFGYDDPDNNDDELYEDAKQAIIEAGKASTSYLQRKLKVGYSRAARLIDILEERGIVGAADGSKPREVLGNNRTSTSTAEALDDTPVSDIIDDNTF